MTKKLDDSTEAQEKIKWPYDAENLRIDALEYIYPTDIINNFLKSEGIFFVCGLRGIGKTLMLKAKRKKYMNLPQSKKESYVMIPDESGEINYLENLNPPEHKWELLGKINIWRDIWGLSIGLSIISYFLEYLDEKSKDKLLWSLNNISAVRNSKYDKFDEFITVLLDYTTHQKLLPSKFVETSLYYLDWNMLQSNLISEINNNISNIILQDIRSGCVVLIDQVDKSWENLMTENCENISKLDKLQEIWYSCQIGLIHAVNDICTRNHHIRVFTSVRQEVLGRLAKDPNYLRYLDKMLIVSYTKDDLKKIFIKSIETFEIKNKDLAKPELLKKNTIKAFLGFDDVEPLRINVHETESIFNYMYRHTIQRPRDIISMGNEISKIEASKRNKHEIQRKINKIAEVNLATEYLADLTKFLKINFELAYSLIETNILEYEDIKEICADYNKLEHGILCKKKCKKCYNTHLFCALYNIGLLGTVENDILEDDLKIQKFLEPQNRKLINSNSIIPSSEVYLLHPVLSHLIEKYRNDFTLYPTIIGDQREYSFIIGKFNKTSPEQKVKDNNKKSKLIY